MERTSKKQTRRTTVTNRENSEMENLKGKVENLRLDWLKIVSENGRVGFEQLQKPHHLSFDHHRCRGGGYYFNSPTRAGVLYFTEGGVF